MAKCKHGDFDLMEGCPQCIAERRTAELAGQVKEKLANEKGIGQGLAKAAQEAGAEVKVVEMKMEIEPSVDKDNVIECDGNATEAVIGAISFGVEIPEGSALVDIDAAKAPNFSKHLEAAKRILAIASSREILNETDAKGASDDIVVMTDLKKAIDAERRTFTIPLNDYVKAINEAYKLITNPLTDADQITRGLLTAYKMEQLHKAAEVEKLNQEAIDLAKRQAEANQGVFTVDIKPVPVPFVPKLTRTDQGKSGLVDSWKYEVTDIDLLPREYMMPDDAMLKAIAKEHHDKKEVAGVRFYNSPSLRSSR